MSEKGERKANKSGRQEQLRTRAPWNVFLLPDLLSYIMDFGGPYCELTMPLALPTFYQARSWYFCCASDKWVPPTGLKEGVASKVFLSHLKLPRGEAKATNQERVKGSQQTPSERLGCLYLGQRWRAEVSDFEPLPPETPHVRVVGIDTSVPICNYAYLLKETPGKETKEGKGKEEEATWFICPLIRIDVLSLLRLEYFIRGRKAQKHNGLTLRAVRVIANVLHSSESDTGIHFWAWKEFSRGRPASELPIERACFLRCISTFYEPWEVTLPPKLKLPGCEQEKTKTKKNKKNKKKQKAKTKTPLASKRRGRGTRRTREDKRSKGKCQEGKECDGAWSRILYMKGELVPRQIPIDEALWRAERYDECKETMRSESGVAAVDEWTHFEPWWLLAHGIRTLDQIPPNPENVTDCVDFGYLQESLPFLNRGDFTLEDLKTVLSSLYMQPLPAFLFLSAYFNYDHQGMSIYSPVTDTALCRYFIVEAKCPFPSLIAAELAPIDRFKMFRFSKIASALEYLDEYQEFVSIQEFADSLKHVFQRIWEEPGAGAAESARAIQKIYSLSSGRQLTALQDSEDLADADRALVHLRDERKVAFFDLMRDPKVSFRHSMFPPIIIEAFKSLT